MKTILSSLITLIFILSSSLVQAQKLQELKPLAKKQPVRILTGNTKNYYELEHRKALNFDVLGVDKVIVYSRKRIQNNKRTRYAIDYRFDDNQGLSYKTSRPRVDRRSAYIDKHFKSNVSRFYKKEIAIPSTTKVLNLRKLDRKIDIDIKVIGYKSGKKTALVPIGAKNRKIHIRTGILNNYYKLNSRIRTVLKPGKVGTLLVYTRARMSDNKPKNYTFSYKKDKARFAKFQVKNQKPATKSMYRSFQKTRKPSAFHKTSIVIDDVNQHIEFASKDNVDARFVLVENKKKGRWIEKKTKHKDQVILSSKKTKRERLYNRITKDQAFHFTVNTKKDTRLRIFVRGEFTYDMFSNSDYEIILRKNDKVIKTYKLSSERSKQMKYKNNELMIPGTLDRIFIDVPKGNHQYSISIQNKGKTAMVRVFQKK